MSLLDRESQKTRRQRNKNSKKGGKQDGDEEETDGIVQCLLGTDSNLDNQANDDNKSTVLMDTEGNQSPSQSDDGNLQVEEPDDDPLTVRHIGVAHGCNNDNVYIPTSA